MARILVVDDASFTRKSIQFALEIEGHEIVGFAKNGIEAVKMYSELKPDLVTMDILMAGKDGLSALQEIMEVDQNAKVVMVSVLTSEDKVDEAIAMGAKAYVVKPFKLLDLVNAIEEALK